MSDVLFTTAHESGLKKVLDFVEGIPADAADALKIVGTVAADVATIKGQIGSGDYIDIVAGLKSDIATLTTEVEALKTAATSHETSIAQLKTAVVAISKPTATATLVTEPTK
jgi:hypothetical protein